MAAQAFELAAESLSMTTTAPVRLAVHCQGSAGVHRFGRIAHVALQLQEPPPPVVIDQPQQPPQPRATFVVDLTSSSSSNSVSAVVQKESIQVLRTLLEHDTIVKVMHDCRLASDGLQHTMEIQLQNVHDTCAWHAVLTKNSNASLPAVIKACRLAVHEVPVLVPLQRRADKDENDEQQGDDATSPTWQQQQITCALQGVQKLLDIATVQDDRLRNETTRAQAVRQSNRIFSQQIRSLQAASELRLDHLSEGQIRKRFYGRDNKEFNDMVTRTFTFLYPQPDDSWICYYKRDQALLQVKERMGYPDIQVEPLPPAKKKAVRRKKMKASKRARVREKKAERNERKAAERLLTATETAA
jgi:hypothetical protein